MNRMAFDLTRLSFRVAIGGFCFALLLTGCGSGSNSSGGGNTPPSTPSTANEWTWMSGSNTPNQPGVYGTQGVASEANTPGGRTGAASWTDSSGNLWLFGGLTGTSTGETSLSDLWELNTTSKE